MNKIILLGTITKDIELRYSQTNVAMAKFSIAVKRETKNKEGNYDSDFVNCIAYNQLAETINKYFKKGNRILVEGRIQSGSYTNQKGDKIYTTDVVVEKINFVDKLEKKEETQTEIVKQAMSEDPYETFGKQVSIDDSSLPF